MIYYIYSPKELEFVENVKEYLQEEEVVYLSFDALETLDIGKVSHLLVTGCLEKIKRILTIAEVNTLSVGIIPLLAQKELIRTFALPSKTKDAVALALTPTQKHIDVLYANDMMVLQEVVVGDAPPLDSFDSSLNGKTYLDRIKIFWKTLRKVQTLTHTKMKIIDAKENEIKFSAVGVVGVEYHNHTFASKLLASGLSSTDGKLSIVILSPTSIVQYMGYLFKALVSHLSPTVLPDSVGVMRSSQLYIETQNPLEVLVDSSTLGQTPVLLEVKEKALALSVGTLFWEQQSQNNTPKDSIKIDNLPSDDERVSYLSQAIPLFAHASKAQYATLFSNLREESRVTQNFMVLLILSTMLATFGLFINSSSIIIGAMILAPLMQPIVSLSMGVLRQDSTLEIHGAKSIMVGVLVVLLTSALLALFTPIERLTTEMTGRLSPTILDLFVAIVSGVAAAYVKSNEKILGSLAGVAIAVALVPPIAVAGIGLGWGDWSMFSMALLLFITNLVGIVLSASFTFAILGFSPLHLAKKGILTWMIIVTIVSIPLYSSFVKMEEKVAIQTTLSNIEFSIGRHAIKLTNIEIWHRQPLDEIHCKVISTGILNSKEKQILKKAILNSIGKEFVVIVTFMYRL